MALRRTEVKEIVTFVWKKSPLLLQLGKTGLTLAMRFCKVWKEYLDNKNKFVAKFLKGRRTNKCQHNRYFQKSYLKWICFLRLWLVYSSRNSQLFASKPTYLTRVLRLLNIRQAPEFEMSWVVCDNNAELVGSRKMNRSEVKHTRSMLLSFRNISWTWKNIV